MALKIPKTGLTELLKEGFKHYQGLEEAVYRNINACKELVRITRSSLGPNGLNKMIVNHMAQLFVTNDAATIMKELEVQHPAARLIYMASQQQEQEVGDGTNFTVVFAGELLERAESLLKMGLPPTEISDGFEKARRFVLEQLNELVVETLVDLKDKRQLIKAIRSAVASKQYGYEDMLSSLIADACLIAMPKVPKHFNVDNIRVVKIMGGSVHDTTLVNGMVFGREPESVVRRVHNAPVVVFTCPLEISKTETKGTVLLRNADDLLNFSRDEEKLLEQEFQRIADSGVRLVVTSGSIADLCLHFINRHQMMVLRVPSKFDIRRLCKVTGATPLARVGAPTPQEIGHVDLAEVMEIGGDRCTVVRQTTEGTATPVATIVVRAASKNTLDDMERAIDDGVNVVKTLTKDARLVAGAGATDMELARRLMAYGQKTTGLAQYAIKKYAEALEVVPRVLAENAGMDVTEVVSRLYAAHQAGQCFAGVDIEGTEAVVCDAVDRGILDVLATRRWALEFATTAAITVLTVDQIIMAKAAGGPKPREPRAGDMDPDEE